MTEGNSSRSTAGAPNRDEWKALYACYDRGGRHPYHGRRPAPLNDHLSIFTNNFLNFYNIINVIILKL